MGKYLEQSEGPWSEVHDFQNLCLRKNCVLLNHKNFKCFDEIKDVINTIRVMQQLRNGRCEKERKQNIAVGLNNAVSSHWWFEWWEQKEAWKKWAIWHECCIYTAVNSTYRMSDVHYTQYLRSVDLLCYQIYALHRRGGRRAKCCSRVTAAINISPIPYFILQRVASIVCAARLDNIHIFESGGLFCRVAFLFAFTYFKLCLVSLH